MATLSDAGSRATNTADPVMVDVGWIAGTLGCSTRHVHRLRDGGLMPPPIKLGSLVRWSRRTIEMWIADGCPAVRKGEPTQREDRRESSPPAADKKEAGHG